MACAVMNRCFVLMSNGIHSLERMRWGRNPSCELSRTESIKHAGVEVRTIEFLAPCSNEPGTQSYRQGRHSSGPRGRSFAVELWAAPEGY